MVTESIFCARTSRGRVRYTGPCGVPRAISRARSTTVSTWSPLRNLVVPTRELTQQAALIERFLAPVDEVGSAAAQPFLRERRPAGRKIIGTFRREAFITRSRRVPGADDHVDHDDLRLSRNHGIALSHAYRDKLMGNRDRLGNSFFSAANFANPSTIGPKSVPLLPKKYLIPRARRISKYAWPTVSTGYCDGLVHLHKITLDALRTHL